MAPKSAPPSRLIGFLTQTPSAATHQKRGTLRIFPQKSTYPQKKQLEIEYVTCPQSYPQLPKKKNPFRVSIKILPPRFFWNEILLSSLPVFHAPIGWTASSPGGHSTPRNSQLALWCHKSWRWQRQPNPFRGNAKKLAVFKGKKNVGNKNMGKKRWMKAPQKEDDNGKT